MISKNWQISILSVLAYSDQFQYPLTKDEIWSRLVNPSRLFLDILGRRNDDLEKKMELNKSFFNNVLLELERKKKIINKEGWYCLPGSEKNFALRKKRQVLSNKNLNRVELLETFCQKVPWIVGLGITGSQAVKNISSLEDDIDFIIITKQNRLWLTRPLIIVFSFMLGKKTLLWPLKFISPRDKWCFNLWLDESQLTMSKSRHDFFSAYEILQIQWLVDKERIAEKLKSQNSWINDFLPIHKFKKIRTVQQKNSKLLGYLNQFLFRIQFKYLLWKIKIPRDGATSSSAFLHLGNIKKSIFSNWKKKILEVIK